MTPKQSMLAATAAVVAAGVALVPLTRAPERRAEETAAPSESASSAVTDAEVRFSGKPSRLVIRQWGQVLAEMPAGTSTPWYTTLRLQQPAEAEVQAEWPGATAPQAVELILMPAGKSAVRATRWSEPDTPETLHDIYSLTW